MQWSLEDTIAVSPLGFFSPRETPSTVAQHCHWCGNTNASKCGSARAYQLLELLPLCCLALLRTDMLFYARTPAVDAIARAPQPCQHNKALWSILLLVKCIIIKKTIGCTLKIIKLTCKSLFC